MGRRAACFLIVAVIGQLFTVTVLRAEVAFRIQVVDEKTERGVPLVELQTVNDIRYYTDSQGVAAIDDPEFAGLELFFLVKSHGYEFPQDGFGFRGTKLKVVAGQNAVLKIKRINIAERLYRLTGAGIYRDSWLTGMPVPIKSPLLNSQVFGCDATVSAIYRNQIYWFWGDTNRPQYPLGNFHVTGATSSLPGSGGLDPSVGVDLEIFTGDDGFARAMTTMPGGQPTWISGLTVIHDEKSGRERMFAGYVRVKSGVTIDHHGLAEYDDSINCFQSVADFGKEPVVEPTGHPIRMRVGEIDYLYFGTTIPFIRVPARAESLSRIEDYEAYTCLRASTRLSESDIERAPDGSIVYEWKRNTSAVGPQDQNRLTEPNSSKPIRLKQHEGLFQFRDRDTYRPITAHYGSCEWNDYRKRFVLIFVQENGDHSKLGEVWYAEADSPLGPWVYTVKIVTHDRYTFYNPKQHPAFAQKEGRLIYFDGTYSHDFSDNPDQTPRYDYNQIMYRLDLEDPKLQIPIAIYRGQDSSAVPFTSSRAQTRNEAPTVFDRSKIAFFAFDRPAESLVPVYLEPNADGKLSLELATDAENQSPLFYALPADSKNQSPATELLFEYVAKDGRRNYSVEQAAEITGYERNASPICRVWKNPFMPR